MAEKFKHTVTSYSRGHKIYCPVGSNTWYFCDTDEEYKGQNRACIKCGKLPTKEGYDYCLGKLKGVKAACCGHGVEKGYILYKNGKRKILKTCKN